MTDPQQPDAFRAPAPPPVPPVPQAPASQATAFPTPAYEAPAYEAPAFSAPAYQAPVGAYQAPVGGYQTAVGPYAAPTAPEPQSRTTGVLALILSLVAVILVPIFGAVAAFAVGSIIPGAVDDVTSADFESLAFLSPARDEVLWTEISFWTGTVLGIGAFVLGILAIVKRRGRGQGIAAVVVSVLGPVLFFTAVFIALGIGAAAGAAEMI
ncbi:hypothetical protein M2317_002131 [Microbacterium sp. ZKA21]|uniref:hypothetical protein n=1 Tax=Microbacterium sp. ZKA21 TaxID=3381694 RepID=UPI003D19032B